MTSIVFTMDLKGEMVAVSVEAKKEKSVWVFSEFVVIDHADWKLTASERKLAEQSASYFLNAACSRRS